MTNVVEQTPQQTSAYERLKRRHQRFVDAYVEGNTATGALRAAGNKSGQVRKLAHRLLHDPDIQAAIRERTLIAIHDAGAHTVEIMRQMAAVATSDVRKLTNPDGTHKAPHELDDQTALAIKSVEVEEVSTGGREGTRYKYQFWDKPKAAEFIGKAQGLIQTTTNVDARRVTINNHDPASQGLLRAVLRLGEQIAAGRAKAGIETSSEDGSLLPVEVSAKQV